MSSDTVELETIPPGGSFLADLPPPIRRYQYEGVAQLLATREMELRRQQEDLDFSEWLLFTGVGNQAFTRDFYNSDGKIIQRCWASYDNSQHLLLAKMPPSRPHEAAPEAFRQLLYEALSPMGLARSLRLIGSAGSRAEEGSSKHPDCAFLPFRRPRERSDKWPSLVVETAYSDSPSKLFSDAQFWLTKSNGDVKMVVAIRIDRSMPNIMLETWALNDNNGRIHRDQVVTVYKGANNRIYVQGQPLVVGFEKLFLRPSEIPKEMDISFNDEMLKYMATQVWEAQNF